MLTWTDAVEVIMIEPAAPSGAKNAAIAS